MTRLKTTFARGLAALLLCAAALGANLPAAWAQQPTQQPRNLRCDITLTVTASSAYASGNVVGSSGPQQCTGAAIDTGYGGIIQSAILRDKAGQAVNYDLLVFDQNPSASTFTDKSAVTVNTADLAKAIGTVQFSGAVLGAATTMGIFTTTGQGFAYKLTGGTTLYLVLVTRGTPTYASTSDVTLSLVLLPD